MHQPSLAPAFSCLAGTVSKDMTPRRRGYVEEVGTGEGSSRDVSVSLGAALLGGRLPVRCG